MREAQAGKSPVDAGWRRHADPSAALDAILDGAGRAFAEVGVRKATMVDVAQAAGCSRATLYRYFRNREALHLAFVHRATLRIARELAERRGEDPAGNLTDRVLAGIAAVRSDPLLATWFEPENLAIPLAVSQNSELLQAMSVGIVDELGDGPLNADDDGGRRGAWLLRCIVSLLAMPGADETEERAMLDAFVVPVMKTVDLTEEYQ